MTDAEKVRALEAALLDAEQRLARMGELELELREVTTRYDAALTEAVLERDALRAELEEERRARRGMEASLSWRVTAPLRSARRR